MSESQAKHDQSADRDALLLDLEIAYSILTLGIIQAAPRAAVMRPADSAWAEKCTAELGLIIAAEAELAMQVSDYASKCKLVLRQHARALRHLDLAFAPMDAALTLIAEEGEREATELARIKSAHRRDPLLSPLLSNIISRRRDHLRRLARLRS